jgi:hypothetical protein
MRTIKEHNKPLADAFKAKGYKWKAKDGKAYFVDNEGNYAGFPVGYITGPCRDGNQIGKSYASVYLGDGWWQRTSRDVFKLERMALDVAERAIESRKAAS